MLVILTIWVVGVSLLAMALLPFNKPYRLILLMTAVFTLFCLGFALRMTGIPYYIDRGYLLTETSASLATLLFVAALFLGQKKYWKIPSI